MSRKNLYDTIQKNKEEPSQSAFPDIETPVDTPSDKKFMYKPFDFKDGKTVYCKMNYVKEIFKENQINGWFDEEPKGNVIVK